MSTAQENERSGQLPLDDSAREIGQAVRRMMEAGQRFRAAKRAERNAKRTARQQKLAEHKPFDNARQCPPGDND